MTKTELKKLREQCEEGHKKWVARGGKLTFYKCNHCKKLIPTRRPRKQDVSSKGYWDSATICTNCGELNFVAEWPSGRTVSDKMPFESAPTKENHSTYRP